MPSREAAVAYVAAENLRQSSEMVQLEIHNRRESRYAVDLEVWERKFVDEPTNAEEAEECAPHCLYWILD